MKTKTKNSKKPNIVQVNWQRPKTRNIKMSACGSFLSFETNWIGNHYSQGFIYNTHEGLVYVDPGFLQKTYNDLDFLLWDYELQELKPYWKPTAFTQVPSEDFYSQESRNESKQLANLVSKLYNL